MCHMHFVIGFVSIQSTDSHCDFQRCCNNLIYLSLKQNVEKSNTQIASVIPSSIQKKQGSIPLHAPTHHGIGSSYLGLLSMLHVACEVDMCV